MFDVPYCTGVIDIHHLRVLNSTVSYEQSKRVITIGAFDRRWVFCGEPKFSFSHDRRFTSCFKSFSTSQKVNSLVFTGTTVCP
jgi:hypothetical protein